jgi:hypothetical protein
MKEIVQNQADQAPQAPAQGFLSEVRGYISKDGEYLTLVLPGNMRVRKHRNWFLSMLGVPFVPKAAARTEAQARKG